MFKSDKNCLVFCESCAIHGIQQKLWKGSYCQSIYIFQFVYMIQSLIATHCYFIWHLLLDILSFCSLASTCRYVIYILYVDDFQEIMYVGEVYGAIWLFSGKNKCTFEIETLMINIVTGPGHHNPAQPITTLHNPAQQAHKCKHLTTVIYVLLIIWIQTI